MKLLKFLRKWNELLTLPIAILLWAWSPEFLRWIDPTAATFDAGIFQALIFAIIAVLVINFVTWIILKLIFPEAYHYLDDKLEANLHHANVTNIQATWIVLFLFALFFLSMVYLTASLL